MTSDRPIRYLLLAMVSALAATNAIAQGATEAQNPTTLSETYDAWTVQCINRAEDKSKQRTCHMSQELLQRQTRQRVLLFSIARTEDMVKATLIMPFGLLLSEGFRIEVDGKQLMGGAYRTCLPAGCVGEFDLPNTAIKQLESGSTTSVVMTANSGQPTKTDVSLKGFSAAYRRLTALTAD